MLFLMRNWITSGTCGNESDFAEQEHRRIILVEREGATPHYERMKEILRDNPLDIM